MHATKYNKYKTIIDARLLVPFNYSSMFSGKKNEAGHVFKKLLLNKKNI